MALGEIFDALSVVEVKYLLFAMNERIRSLDINEGGGWGVFMATNHLLVVATFLSHTDGLHAWSERPSLAR
jgi:hypothetical protein